MFNTVALFSALLASASLVSSAPAQKTSQPVINIVYNPVITYPTAGVVWAVGETREITWNADDIPQEVKDTTGTIVLGFNENDSENLDLAHPLATGFKLTDEKVNVTVPDVADRSDYIVVLFGDSGNASPEFTINGGSSSSSSVATSTATASTLPTTA
ncbi:uncharacterized protein FOMMEDRAFT_97900 [Fomitiporia mediterranea MF3/22]|uniref:uncharacterized protein n=1 Tax=Fomitiporia mediterranea (strain MF3/22) TaxID=694068 RepID=UPI00044098EC|nr:uncharacterized protein FOMMEDRAFT_97900 [Fomitiporia mediterranea MF3/22]EJC97887.1 hypothetical protein FOMMEDRAFT_97900 [Fomitiporia mediterranea MF3/22]